MTTLSDPDVLTREFVGVRPVTKYPFNVSKGEQRGAKLDRQRETLVVPLFSPVFVAPDRETDVPIDPESVSGTILRRRGIRLADSIGVSASPVGVDLRETAVGTVAGGTARVWFGAVCHCFISDKLVFIFINGVPNIRRDYFNCFCRFFPIRPINII